MVLPGADVGMYGIKFFLHGKWITVLCDAICRPMRTLDNVRYSRSVGCYCCGGLVWDRWA
eukprot:2002372-Rhodomonas_salina.2